MSKQKHYREADTRLHLVGLKLDIKPKKGEPFPQIGMKVETKDGKFAMFITYDTLLGAVLDMANKELKK